jgi:predicted heme/steroid binding protein
MTRTQAVLFVVLTMLLISFPARATEEYSQRTGKSCDACHVDPAGGSDLTDAGKVFKGGLAAGEGPKGLSGMQRTVRFLIGFMHMAFGFLWFGTILYVHIVLKPAYAARGLPRGELLIGWSSIIIMAVTGALLAIARIQSWDALLHTRFGILLMIKVFLYLVMVAIASLATFVVGPRLKKRIRVRVESTKADLTLEELSYFDGKEGRSAYVAYNGRIYDVTKSHLWRDGTHMVKHVAGNDLGDALKGAPHNEDRLLAMPPVGKLLLAPSKPPFHVRGFFFMAYLSLFLVFGILFIISLWRWG